MWIGKGESLSTMGLFAGIGGIERGLELAGHRDELLCEIDPGARKVLFRTPLRGEIERDIRRMGGAFPKVDVIAAGFPCQDLSQAGATAGITGKQSRLVGEVFKRLRHKKNWSTLAVARERPVHVATRTWQGDEIPRRRARRSRLHVGVSHCRCPRVRNPQRRKRVLLLASRTEDPGQCCSDAKAARMCQLFRPTVSAASTGPRACVGLGGRSTLYPSTLKGGSTIGIPSPPAIWDPLAGSISIPDIRDAERLQGFDTDWTSPALTNPDVRRGHRWKLVGNAVSVSVARWAGDRLASPSGDIPAWVALRRGVAWPRAAWGHQGKVYSVDASTWPVKEPAIALREFLRFPRLPLSHRAAAGFLSRAKVSGLHFEAGFLNDVSRHVDRMARSLSTPHAIEVGDEQPACA